MYFDSVLGVLKNALIINFVHTTQYIVCDDVFHSLTGATADVYLISGNDHAMHNYINQYFLLFRTSATPR